MNVEENDGRICWRTHNIHFTASLCAMLVKKTWRRQWHPTPILLPGKSHGQRSLVGCSPRCHKESDTTERLHFHFSLSCIGEGNGNPLQCSCLENPRDEGAWWAAIYGVAQSRTRLKWLSSSSSSNLMMVVRKWASKYQEECQWFLIRIGVVWNMFTCAPLWRNI